MVDDNVVRAVVNLIDAVNHIVYRPKEVPFDYDYLQQRITKLYELLDKKDEDKILLEKVYKKLKEIAAIPEGVMPAWEVLLAEVSNKVNYKQPIKCPAKDCGVFSKNEKGLINHYLTAHCAVGW